VRLLTLIAAAAAATSFAAAALTTVAGGAIGGGSATLAPCDGEGFSADYDTSAGAITAVTVTGIADPACDGGAVRVAVVDGSGVALATGGPTVVAADGDGVDSTVSVAVPGLPAAADARRIEIVVEGP